MTTIKLYVTEQNIIIEENPLIASGDLNTVQLQASFSPEWAGFSRTAVFYQDEANAYHAVLGHDNTCLIPWEVLAHEGTLYLGIYGMKDDRRMTTEIIRYTIHKGAWLETQAPADPSPDIYAQISAELAEVQAGIEGGWVTKFVDQHQQRPTSIGFTATTEELEAMIAAGDYAADCLYIPTDGKDAEELEARLKNIENMKLEQIPGVLAVNHGGTGGTTKSSARNNLGIRYDTQDLTLEAGMIFTSVDFEAPGITASKGFAAASVELHLSAGTVTNRGIVGCYTERQDGVVRVWLFGTESLNASMTVTVHLLTIN